MGIYFVQAVSIVALFLNIAPAQAQKTARTNKQTAVYKNASQFACKRVTISAAAPETPERYPVLDQELSYANQALRNPNSVVGTWKFDMPDENNTLLTNTVEFKMINGWLHSRLVNWGGRFTSEYSLVVQRDETDVANFNRAILILNYPGSSIKIYMRPISKNKMRYSFGDHCEINYPDNWSPVFTRK